ncbi:hypothetical protein TNCV_1119821 [Trichonephila clavipes]|uniref:Uncharacterized protein n=1 Tax=Trichonephila clavipes TaxID=2585209 RepID=A0A8X6T7Q0_TRICX|nr:hypothetical protein TNCV_1119821 [Trichonephila clavipes]
MACSSKGSISRLPWTSPGESALVFGMKLITDDKDINFVLKIVLIFADSCLSAHRNSARRLVRDGRNEKENEVQCDDETGSTPKCRGVDDTRVGYGSDLERDKAAVGTGADGICGRHVEHN